MDEHFFSSFISKETVEGHVWTSLLTITFTITIRNGVIKH